MTKEIRMTKLEFRTGQSFPHSGFVIDSSFVIRHSSFEAYV